MFTRRTLFKLMAAIGAGQLFPSAGEAAAARRSIVCAACSDHSAMPGSTHPDVPDQALAASAIEQWESLVDDLDAVELIGRYVSLRPTGDDARGSTGRCPFCRQGPDSLMVSSRDDSYFCTHCLAGGHALDFHARMEGLSLPDSLCSVGKLMAAGELQGKRPRRKRFHCIIEAINRFAHESLICSRKGASARGWLNEQGVPAGMTENFSLGVMSYALGRQLLELLHAAGFTSDELEQAGVDGWMSCWEDRLKAGESNSTLLLPVRDRDGYCCGFYEQSLGPEAALTWSSHVFPYGYQLLSPHRFNRLVYSATNGQKVPSSVVLAERPWDVVLLASAGMEDAVYVEPLDSAEYREHPNSYLWRVTSAIWPIRQADVTVEFLRHLLKCSNQSIGRLRFMVLPPGTRLSELIRREGVEAVRGRLAEAKSMREWFGV